MVSDHIHNPKWWQQDQADFQAQLAPYAGLTPEEVSDEHILGLLTIALGEVSRLREIVRELALGQAAVGRTVKPPQPASRRGRPPKQPNLTVEANTDGGTVEMMGLKLSPDQARELGSQLLQAAEVIAPSDTDDFAVELELDEAAGGEA